MKMENSNFKLQATPLQDSSVLAMDLTSPNSGLYYDNQVRRYLKAAARRHDTAARNKRILASVLQEWTEVGYLKAQISSVANRAGMSTATLYRLFPDKNALFLEALKFGQSILVDALANYIAHPNPIRDLTEMLRNHAETLAQPAPLQLLLTQRIMIFDSKLHDQVCAIATENHQRVKENWHAKIQSLREAGWIKLDQIEWQRCRLVGALEARTFGWFMLGQAPSKPAVSWEHDAYRVVQDFFRLYGTEKFWENCRQFNWDWGLP